MDLLVGLTVVALALGCGWISTKKFDLWFGALAREELARVAGKAMIGLSVTLAVGVALSWWRIEVGLIPSSHGDLDEFRALLTPCVGLVPAVLGALYVGDRVLARAHREL